MLDHRHRVVVIGGGISGLSSAHFLKKLGVNVTVLESTLEAGGMMQTSRENGWLIEAGPNSLLETTPLLRQLAHETGISSKLLHANETASKRYIVRNSTLYPLPTGMVSFLKSKLWTTRGKFRLLQEPLIGRSTREESIAEFVERRLGREFLDYAVNPFVAGVYAGDPAKLSLRSTFPKLFALEQQYGGLIVGAIRSRRERKLRDEVAKDRAQIGRAHV